MGDAVPAGLRAAVLRRDRGVCGLCRRPVNPEDWHADHIIPRALGGPTVAANLQVSHPDCNQRKSDRILFLPDGPARRALGRTYAIAARLAGVGIHLEPLPFRFASRVSVLVFRLPGGRAHITPALVAEVRAAVAHADRVMGLPPTHQRVAVRGDGDVLVVEVPRRTFAPVLVANMPAPVGLEFPLGEDMAGRPVMASIGGSSAPHWMVAGATDSGKSVALLTLAFQAVRGGAEIAVADVDGWGTFAPLAGIAAHWMDPAEGPAAAAAVVQAVAAEVHARQPGMVHPPLVLFVDELHMLPRAAMRALGEIVLGGRKRRVHLVMASHYPKSTEVSRVTTQQVGHRLCLRVEDEVASRTIIGRGGAEMLLGRGHGLYRRGGIITPLQVALVRPEDCLSLPMGSPRQAPSASSRSAKPGRPAQPLEPLVELARQRAQAGQLRPHVAEDIRLALGVGRTKARAIRDLLTGGSRP